MPAIQRRAWMEVARASSDVAPTERSFREWRPLPAMWDTSTATRRRAFGDTAASARRRADRRVGSPVSFYEVALQHWREAVGFRCARTATGRRGHRCFYRPEAAGGS